MGHMTLILLSQGRFEDAAKWAHEALDISKAALNKDDPDNMDIEAVLVKIYICERRFQDAERLQTDLLERVTRLIDEEHPYRLTPMHNLALIWKNLGRLWNAKDLLSSCAEFQIKTLGYKHSSTKSSRETG